MSDLYTNLTDLHDMARTLIDDVEVLRPHLGSTAIEIEKTPEEKANRRFFVRAVFALVEAVVEQHKRLLLELQRTGRVSMEQCDVAVLSEKIYYAKDNGAVQQRDQYLSLKSKLRAVYRIAGEAFGRPLSVDFGGTGWPSFGKSIAIRDRITHPKTMDECRVSSENLETVEEGHSWFRGLQNEYVRVAREHRSESGW